MMSTFIQNNQYNNNNNKIIIKNSHRYEFCSIIFNGSNSLAKDD